MNIYACLILLSLSIFAQQTANTSDRNESIQWKSVPITIEKDILKKRSGGEGFQMVEYMIITKSDPNIMYISTNTSQVWKSVNSGETWMSAREGILSNGISSLAVSDNNSDIVFAAGTYGVKKNKSEMFPNRYEGIYRSLNGGKNWEYVKSTHFYVTENKGRLISIVSTKSKIPAIYAGSSNEGIIKSNDLGNTWHKLSNNISEITDIAVDPNYMNIIYVAAKEGLFKYDGALFKKIGFNLPDRPMSIAVSSDGTDRLWVTVKEHGVYISHDRGKLFEPSGARNAVVLSISPVNSNLIFAKSDRTKTFREPLVSNDGGITWVKSKLGDDLEPNFDNEENQFWFSGPIVAHPINENIVFTVSNGKGRILKSYDTGKTWLYSGSGFTGARMRDIAFKENGGIILALTDHGLWNSNNGDNGPFQYLPVPRINKSRSIGAVLSRDSQIVATVGSWQKKAIVLSNDNGKTWNVTDALLDTKHEIFYDNNNEKYIYAANYISSDKGNSWKEIGYKILAVDENSRLYSTKKNSKNSFRVIISDDNGKTWKNYTDSISYDEKKINKLLVVTRKQDTTIYVATYDGIIIIRNSQYKFIGEKNGLARDEYGLVFVNDIKEDKRNSNILYAARRSPGYGQSNGVFISLDGGENWSNINGNLGKYLSVWSLKLHPITGDLFIGTSLGVFRTNIPNTWRTRFTLR